MTQFQRKDLFILAGLIGLALVLALPVVTYPMGRDQGMYANIARTILNGGLPFVDMWDIKPPAIYYIYAVGIALFGPGAAALRGIDLVTVPFTLAALYWLALKLSGRGAAVLTCVLFPVFYFTETFASLTQSDAIVTLPMTLAVFCVVNVAQYPRASRAALIWSVGAGALCALTIWFKHYYALFVLALVIEHVLTRRGIPYKEALAFCLGGLPVGALPLAYFVSTGVWDEMLIVARGTAQYNAQSYTGLDTFIGQIWHYFLFRLQHWGVVIALAAFWPFAAWRGQFSLGQWRIVGLWLLSGLGFVLIQGKGFDTHWIPMLPPLVLFAASALDAGLHRILSGLGQLYKPNNVNSARTGVILVYGLVTFALSAILVKDTWIRAWPHLSGTEPLVVYYARFQANDLKPNESLRVIRYLQRRTVPGDTLYIWGFRPEVYYLSNLRPATRFQAQFPLASTYYPPEWRQENVDTLWAALPPYVLVLQADYMRWVTGRDDDSAWILAHDYSELNDWLICNYQRVEEMGDFLIWKRLEQSCLQN